jgi:cobalt-zinc-cadmium efflux system protein
MRGHDHHEGSLSGDHAHGHLGSSHASFSYGRAFKTGIGLNVVFVLVEAVFGVLSNSMALLADAGHNASDVLGLLLAWGASRLVTRPPTQRYTYGLGATSILAAMGNAVFLLLTCGAIAWEAVQRFFQPAPVATLTVVVVAAIGIAINGITAWMFFSGRNDDMNIRGAFLHMAGDAAISLGVVISGVVMIATQWSWVDPLVSLVIVAVIVWSSWGLLRDSTVMALQAVPPGIDVAEVRATLEKLPGVDRIHDLHIWPLSTTSTALTCHLVMPTGHPGDMFVVRLAQTMRERFGIDHVTVQIEKSEAACVLQPDDVV